MSLIPRRYQSILAAVLLVSYTGFLALGFLHVLHMASMETPMNDCPLAHVLQEHTTASPGDAEGIATTILVTVLSYLSISIILRAYTMFVPKVRHACETVQEHYAQRKRKQPHRFLYAFLFSQGILHPRPF